MPPCAHRVEPSSMLTLVTTVTCSPCSRRCSAAVRPAIPEPTTSTSVVSVQPGSAAASRLGSAGSIRLPSRSASGGGMWLLVLDRQRLLAAALHGRGEGAVADPQIAPDSPVAHLPLVLAPGQRHHA